MNKIINFPKECAYRKPLFTRLGLLLYISCNKGNNIVCPKYDEFPVNCPLPNGIIKKKTPKIW